MGKREPNGRIKRSGVDALERKVGVKSVAAAQRHRNLDPERPANMDQRCESPFGRFCMRRKIRVDWVQAADHYEGLVRRWRAARGVPTELRLGYGVGGDGPDEKTVRAWNRDILKFDAAMSAASHDGWLALRDMLLDQRDAGMDRDGVAVMALEALALATGLKVDRRPF